MGFPVTILGVTYNLSDFTGLGYVTNLPAIITRINNCATAYLPSSASTTSMAVSLSTRSVTVATNSLFEVGNFVTCFYDSTNYMYGIVTAYTPSTGVMTFEPRVAVGAGTYATWQVAQAPYLREHPAAVLGISEGGIGEQAFNTADLSLDRKAEFVSGFHLINLDASDLLLEPNHYEVSYGVPASGNAKLKGNAAINKSAVYLNGAAYAEVKDVGDKAFWSLGKKGYLSFYNCGDTYTLIRISGDSPTATENYKFRMGMLTNNAANLSNHEDYGAFGVELTYGTELTVRYFCNLPGVSSEASFSLSLNGFSTFYNEFCIRYNHLNKELTMGINYTSVYEGGGAFTVNLEPFFEKLKALGGSFRVSNMLRPFVYMEKTVGTAVKAVGFQEFQTKQYLRRA